MLKSTSPRRLRATPAKLVACLLVACLLAAAPLLAQSPAPPVKKAAVALVDAADAAQWQTWCKEADFAVIVPTVAADAGGDARVQALQAAVDLAVKAGWADPSRIYVAGRGAAAAAVFYTISRTPDLWAAGIAIGGSPLAAIETGRVFGANFTNTPVLWIGGGPDDETFAAKLKDDGVRLEWRAPAGISNQTIFKWLLSHVRPDFPAVADCETNAPAFAHCYWIQPTKFDVNERNDVLPSTIVTAGSGAALDVGGFGFKKDEPGPGLTVSYLPNKYSGPLKMGDRLLELDGKPIASARQFLETMSVATEEKRVVVLIERGKDRIRLETRIVLPHRAPIVAARVQGLHEPLSKDIQIVSRMVAEMKVTIPPEWAPGNLFWNGLSLEDIEKPGCYQLTLEKELLHAEPCK